MSEILTESFCERCGTRYTFESARPKNRLKGVKVLSRGLKNFVLSDDTTMDEAMAAARSETDHESTAHQLDAFHKTFSFCMSCRQYTCPNCWNDLEARCQSCAPLPELEIAAPEVVPPVFPGLVTLAGTAAVAEPAANGTNGHAHDPFTVDQPGAIQPELEPEAAEAEAGAAVEPVVPELDVAAGPATSDKVVSEPTAKATSQTIGLLHRFRPGQSLDDELAEFERERSSAEAEAPATAAVEIAEAAAEAVPEGVAAVPSIAEPESQAVTPGPIAPEPEAATAARTEPEPEPAPLAAEAEPEPAAATADVVEQPTWRITAPDVEAPPLGVPGEADAISPIHASPSSLPPAEPQWPATPEWPAPQASAGLPFLSRPARPQGGVEALWAASNRELAATPPVPGRSTSGIQPCISCGLSLSATARFCRRCGTLQGG